MNQKTALAVILVFLTLSVTCITAAAANTSFPLINAVPFPNNESHQGLAFSAALAVGTTLHSNSSLDQPTRREIYNFVKANPGIHFRGICSGLGLSVGVVQYHLSILEHAGLLVAYNDGQSKRYFEPKAAQSDVALISLLRHKAAGKILFALSQSNAVLHKDLANCLGVSSQALSWHMNQLKPTGLISAQKDGVNVRYSLTPTARTLLTKLTTA